MRDLDRIDTTPYCCLLYTSIFCSCVFGLIVLQKNSAAFHIDKVTQSTRGRDVAFNILAVYGNLTKKAILALLLEGSINHLRFRHLLHPVVRSFIFILYVLYNLIKLWNLYQISLGALQCIAVAINHITMLLQILRIGIFNDHPRGNSLALIHI